MVARVSDKSPLERLSDPYADPALSTTAPRPPSQALQQQMRVARLTDLLEGKSSVVIAPRGSTVPWLSIEKTTSSEGASIFEIRTFPPGRSPETSSVGADGELISGVDPLSALRHTRDRRPTGLMVELPPQLADRIPASNQTNNLRVQEEAITVPGISIPRGSILPLNRGAPSTGSSSRVAVDPEAWNSDAFKRIVEDGGTVYRRTAASGSVPTLRVSEVELPSGQRAFQVSTRDGSSSITLSENKNDLTLSLQDAWTRRYQTNSNGVTATQHVSQLSKGTMEWTEARQLEKYIRNELVSAKVLTNQREEASLS